MTALEPQPADDGAIPLARRLNLWLGKFASAHSRRAYADDLGIPYEWRDWQPARDTAPARPRRPMRRGVAFFPWCAGHGLNPLQVGLEQLQQWLAATREAGLAKRTRARMLTSVSEFYTAMQRQNLPVPNPALLVDRRAAGLLGTDEDDDQLYLDVDQTRQLLIAARNGSGRGRDLYRERDLVVLKLLAVTGARASEVVALNLADYRRADPRGPAEVIYHGKGGKVRRATVDVGTADDIDAWIRVRADRLGTHLPARHGDVAAGAWPLLCTRTGTRLAVSHLGTIMTAVAKRPGCPLAGIADQLHPHALRAAFVTAALDAGVPIEEVRDAVGHAAISTTLRYDRRRRRRQSRAFTIVSGLFADDTKPSSEQPPLPLHQRPHTERTLS